jgi:hypothetical protein
MLGDSTLRSSIEGQDTVEAKPQVVAEWNMNSIASSFIHGTETHPTSFTPLSLQKGDAAPAITTITETSNFNRTFYSPVFNDNSSQLIVASSSSSSALVSGYAMTNGVASLILKNKINIENGDSIQISGVGTLFDGSYILSSQIGGVLISYNTNNSSSNVPLSSAPIQGRVSANVADYYVDFTVSTYASRSAKIFFKLKSDYNHQSESSNQFLEQFNVTLRAVGLKNNEPVYTQSITKNYLVDSTSWTNAHISFANPDSQIDVVRVYLSVEPSNDYKAALLVDQIFGANVSDFEVYTEDRTPLSQVFDVYRPGEVILDAGSKTVEINSTLTYPQQCTPVQMAHKYAIGNLYEKVQRSVTPFAGNPYSYYVSASGWGSKRIWCIYDKNINVNKLVIKVNAIAAKPAVDSFTIKILVNKQWQEINTDSMNFTNNGILTLYYNGSSWSNTAWSQSAIPTISTTTGQIDKKLSIQGVAFECVSQSYTIENSPLNKNDALETLELIEISPRLELDLSKYVVGLNINKELEGSDIPLPLGSITSNTATVDFSNIPIVINDSDAKTSETDDIVPISNYAIGSPLKDLLVKGVKIKGSFNVNTGLSSGTQTISNAPSFVMYVERWQESVDSVSAECYDAVKRLQSTKARPLYLKKKSINEIIYSILDSVGFGDYYFDELAKLKIVKYENDNAYISNTLDQSIEYFWAIDQDSVVDTLNELLKPYQVSLYSDEYGAIRFLSLYQINKKAESVSDTDVVYIQDMNQTLSGGRVIRSNLMNLEFEEIERPEKATIKYKRPMPSLSDYRQYKDRKNVSMTENATDIVWEPEQFAQVLSFFKLASPGILTPTQNRIPFDVDSVSRLNRAIENSGYLLIDQEIIKYDGLEYIFNYTNSNGVTQSRLDVVKNASDIDRVISEIYQINQSSKITWTPSGQMVNVERGCFGTEPSPHVVLANGSRSGWVGREFNAAYNQVSSIDESDGTFGAANGSISIKSTKASGGILIYPSNNNTVGNKRRFFSRYVLNNVPSGKTGYLGSVIGLKINNSQITHGLFIWTGITNKNKQTNITISIIQIVNGDVKVVSDPKDFEFTEDLFSDNEALEMYVEFNNEMNKMKVFIGSTSLFEVVRSKDKEDDPGKRKVAFKTLTTDISSIKKDGFFGFAALENGRGVLDSMAFTANSDPRNLNNIEINDLTDQYYSSSSTSQAYYANANSLLNQIVYNQFIAGFSTFKDSFVFTGAPVARGIKIFDVEYQDYPVIASPEVEFLGYTYNIDAIRNPTAITGTESNK